MWRTPAKKTPCTVYLSNLEARYSLASLHLMAIMVVYYSLVRGTLVEVNGVHSFPYTLLQFKNCQNTQIGQSVSAVSPSSTAVELLWTGQVSCSYCTLKCFFLLRFWPLLVNTVVLNYFNTPMYHRLHFLNQAIENWWSIVQESYKNRCISENILCLFLPVVLHPCNTKQIKHKVEQIVNTGSHVRETVIVDTYPGYKK